MYEIILFSNIAQKIKSVKGLTDFLAYFNTISAIRLLNIHQ